MERETERQSFKNTTSHSYENLKGKNCPTRINITLKKLDREAHWVSVFRSLFYFTVILKYGNHTNCAQYQMFKAF